MFARLVVCESLKAENFRVDSHANGEILAVQLLHWKGEAPFAHHNVYLAIDHSYNSYKNTEHNLLMYAAKHRQQMQQGNSSQ